MKAGAFTVIESGAILGEGPLWCERSQSLLWIDGSRPQYFRWRWGAELSESWPLERPPAAFAQVDDGRLLIAFRERMGVMDGPGMSIEEIGLPGLALGDQRFNDAKADRAGRLWIGTIDRALRRPIGQLWRMDAEGFRPMDGGFAQSNGIGWSPDGRSMYFSESFERRVHRFQFDALAGTIARDGTLARFPIGLPKPDGLTVDAEGGIWCAVFGGGCINRYLPDGRLDRCIRLPVSNPTSCMFGGPDLKTLFVTTASFGLDDAAKRAQPLAGSVFALASDIPGLPEPLLRGGYIRPLRAASSPSSSAKGLTHA